MIFVNPVCSFIRIYIDIIGCPTGNIFYTAFELELMLFC